MMDALRYWFRKRTSGAAYSTGAMPPFYAMAAPRMWREPRPEGTEAPEEKPWTEDGMQKNFKNFSDVRAISPHSIWGWTRKDTCCAANR